MPRHDSAYRSLFSHPAMMAELLQGVVRQPWLAQVDLSTLERINGEHVAARGGKRRTSDMVWRVWGKRDWVYVYLLLEFQSRSDPAMALRMLTYLGCCTRTFCGSRARRAARGCRRYCPSCCTTACRAGRQRSRCRN